MKEKLSKLLLLIADNRNEIEDIVPNQGEYYFSFRHKTFSVSGSSPTSSTFFVYPKWQGTSGQLIGASVNQPERPDLSFVYITAQDVIVNTGLNLVQDLYGWLDSKSTGLDKLFQDLGID